MSLKRGKLTDLPLLPTGGLDGFGLQPRSDRDESLFEDDEATKWLRSPEGKRKAKNLSERRRRAKVGSTPSK